jgi:hypothetical protein
MIDHRGEHSTTAALPAVLLPRQAAIRDSFPTIGCAYLERFGTITSAGGLPPADLGSLDWVKDALMAPKLATSEEEVVHAFV